MAIPLTLTTAELIAAVGKLEGKRLPPRTVSKWAAMGVLVPSVQWTGQRRTPRIYVLRDLAKARLILRLRAAGMSMAMVRVVLAELARRGDLRELLRPNSTAVLEVRGWDIRVHVDGLVTEVPSGQLVLPLVDVVRDNDQVAREVRKRAAA